MGRLPRLTSMKPIVGITSYAQEAGLGLLEAACRPCPALLREARSWRPAARPLARPSGGGRDRGDAGHAPRADPLWRGRHRPRRLRGGAPRRDGGDPPHRDDAELPLLEAALARDMPVLAICRGMQLLNVAHGGDLHQHLPERVGHENHRAVPGTFSDHDVRLQAASGLSAILGTGGAGQVLPSPGARSGRPGSRRRGLGRGRLDRGDRGSPQGVRARSPLASRGGRGQAPLRSPRRAGPPVSRYPAPLSSRAIRVARGNVRARHGPWPDRREHAREHGVEQAPPTREFGGRVVGHDRTAVTGLDRDGVAAGEARVARLDRERSIGLESDRLLDELDVAAGEARTIR